MKRMLFNATQSEELRVATIDGEKLEDLDFERGNKEQRKSNIYKAVVTRVEPSLEAAFVNYGVDRHGFLPFKEISSEYYSKKTRKKSVSIKDVISEGQELIVQVTKDERGNKGAALTTYLSLAGRYIVLMPNNKDGGGISRRIEGDERSKFKETLVQVKVPKGMSVIGRTAGIGINSEDIQWDLDYLSQLWNAIENAGKAQSGSFLIYQESNLVIRAIRDYFSTNIEEILIDKKEIYDQAHQFMSHVMPMYADRIKLYDEEISLFSKYKIEAQIESAFLREVQLPSGGSIVIDHTEALVSIDVNSSRSTKGRDIENTAFNTNIEAANEVSKQLRMRDIGGLIVIDFIDMENSKNQRDVENTMLGNFKQDKARIQMNKISKFGLLELSRQRLRPSLGESVNGLCPRCDGTGRVRDVQSTALFILRLIQEEANKKSDHSISIQIPVEVATLLLNEKRDDIKKIEDRSSNRIIIIPNRYFEIPKYHLDSTSSSSGSSSYKLVEQPLEDISSTNDQKELNEEKLEPVVKNVIPADKNKKNKSIFGFFKNLIGVNESDLTQSEKTPESINKEREKIESSQREGGRKAQNFNKRPNRNRRSPYKGKGNPNQNSINEKKEQEAKRIEEAKKVEINEVKNPAKKKVPKLEKIDLEKVGLKLVETTIKSNKQEQTKAPEKKAIRKTASWQKKKEVIPKATKKLVMIETKKPTTKAAKKPTTKAAKKPTTKAAKKVIPKKD
jgi:ribonuclease E